jgi:hypothetical protein
MPQTESSSSQENSPPQMDHINRVFVPPRAGVTAFWNVFGMLKQSFVSKSQDLGPVTSHRFFARASAGKIGGLPG